MLLSVQDDAEMFCKAYATCPRDQGDNAAKDVGLKFISE
jgi:hypothetical protein